MQRINPRSLVKMVLHIELCSNFGWAGEHFVGDSQNSEDDFSAPLVILIIHAFYIS